RIWFDPSKSGIFRETEGVWMNPNKESVLLWTDGPDPWSPADAAAGISWVLVRERGGRPEAPALRAIAERGGRAPEGLTTAAVWMLQYPGASADAARERAERAALVRSSREGLLVNPHSQACRITPPPRELQGLGALLLQLQEET